jgi:hypothetical protein
MGFASYSQLLKLCEYLWGHARFLENKIWVHVLWLILWLNRFNRDVI